MVSDQQVRRLFKVIQQDKTLSKAAAKAGLDVKTARKYRRLRKLPSELHQPRTCQTRKDAFEEVWNELREQLSVSPGLEAKTLFDALQRKHPGRFADGQLRAFQRRVRRWRASEGPPKEVFFSQVHEPVVSAWGMLVLVLLLWTVGSVLLGRDGNAADRAPTIQ